MIALARRLARLGVLGLNARNAGLLTSLNPRAVRPVVDDKAALAGLCERVGIPTPELYAVVRRHGDIAAAAELVASLAECGCVVKPARGFGGRGVRVLPPGFEPDRAALAGHLAETLAGRFSLGGTPDAALVQRLVTPHPALEPLAPGGIPDVRVVVYRGEPAMAMLRLPTARSAGRANLHQGGVGVGVDLATGHTTHALHGGDAPLFHPDTDAPLVGVRVPHWPTLLALAVRLARATGLGYVGADLVIDGDLGPMALEANARPGLAIQLANRAGLAAACAAIDARLGR